MNSLAAKTLFITGASRGIGKAIALRAARDGANIVIAGRTLRPHPTLPGTIESAAAEVREAGGQALACLVNVRLEKTVQQAVDQAVERFGGIDILVNNASAIQLTGTLQTPLNRYDLVHNVNVRGTFVCSQLCAPHLARSPNPHILNLAPPPRMSAYWCAKHLAYTVAKYGMSMCVLGMAEEFRSQRIAVNALWPQTAIATSAVENLLGGQAALAHCRRPEIVADAAHAILCRDSRHCTGNFFIDEEVLRHEGCEDFEPYAVQPGTSLAPDFFLADP